MLKPEKEELEEGAVCLGSYAMTPTCGNAAFHCEERADCLWQVVRAMDRTPLSEGDCFKIGRIVMRVIQACVSSGTTCRCSD